MRKLLLPLFICFFYSQNFCAQEFLHIGSHVIPLSNVTKITSSVRVHPESLSLLLEADGKISIYVSALKATGMMDTITHYIDKSYQILNVEDSCRWNNVYVPGPGAPGASYLNVAFPEERRLNFTFFACPDSILKTKYQITNLDGLRKKAKEIYSKVYPEDANVTDETDRRNYLNRFISYQLLSFCGTYNTLTGVDGDKLANNFDRMNVSIADWYETMMPYSIIKFSVPDYQRNIYINRRTGANSRPDDRGVRVLGVKVLLPTQGPEHSDAINGAYHYIDDIVAYDKNTQEVVLDERIRFDCTTLSPDFMTKLTDGETARGHSAANNGKYTSGNDNHSMALKSGFVRNFEFDKELSVIVSNRSISSSLYQGDMVALKGMFDVKVKLPPVPAGTYELRLGYAALTSNGIVAFYIDGEPMDIVDLRQDAQEQFNWKSDDMYLYSEEEIADFERSARNKGWMKGPASYSRNNGRAFDESNSLRNNSFCMRKIIGTFTTDGKSEHFLRLQQQMPNGESTMAFDYIELVPASVYDSEEYQENKW